MYDTLVRIIYGIYRDALKQKTHVELSRGLGIATSLSSMLITLADVVQPAHKK